MSGYDKQINDKFLYEIGATYVKCEKLEDGSFIGGEWRLWDGRLHWLWEPECIKKASSYQWYIMGVKIPAPTTQQQVLDLCRCLGVKLLALTA